MFRTKIFIRLPQTIFRTEDAFQRRKHELATLIQKTWRGYAQRRKYLIILAAIKVVQKYWRRWLAIRVAERRRHAVKVIRR